MWGMFDYAISFNSDVSAWDRCESRRAHVEHVRLGLVAHSRYLILGRCRTFGLLLGLLLLSPVLGFHATHRTHHHHDVWGAAAQHHDDSTSSSSSSSSSSLPGSLSRRSLFSEAFITSSSLAGATLTGVASPAAAEIGKESEWPLWPALPVAPYRRRKTIRQEVVPGQVWTFDQLIGIYYVQLPIRMTVVKLQEGGLFVYAPVAPTAECLALLRPLIDAHGPVKSIVLPSVAVEHKVNAGPFARRFPDAAFYAVDAQYSFPVPLPSRFLGLPSWTQPLPASSSSDSNSASSLPWGDEFEHEVLTVFPGPASAYQDAAFFHRPSKTLLVCDAIFAVDETPPPILTDVPEYVKALLFHARDEPLEVVPDSPEARRKGWQRIVLLFNFFFPGSAVGDLGIGPLLKLDGSYPYGWGGWLPFSWRGTEGKAFETFSQGGKPTVLPIIQIILARGSDGGAARQWVEKITGSGGSVGSGSSGSSGSEGGGSSESSASGGGGGWNFERVVPQHLNAPLVIGPKEFREAFAFAFNGRNDVRFCDEDVKFLRSAEEGFLSFSVFDSKLGVLRGKEGCEL